MSSQSLSLSIIQANLLWENKPGNLKMFEEKITTLSRKTEVVVLPEMFSTGFSMNAASLAETMDGPSVEWMMQTAAKNKIILTGSLIIKEDTTNGTQFYNRLIWMLPNGKYGYYDKRHLFAFAGEDHIYTAGSKRLLASVKDWKINVQVCYDLRFPVWSRQQTPQEYDLLLYVANWPQRRSHAWKTLLQARAIENQCYVIGVNRVGNDGNDIYHSGDSMVVDPLGEILHTTQHKEDVINVVLQKEKLQEVREKFPFWKDADSFKIF